MSQGQREKNLYLKIILIMIHNIPQSQLY